LFNRETMEPLIAGPPFVRALEELVNTAKLNPADTAELNPQQCVDLVINGEAAMAIGFLDRRTKTLPTSSIAIAELPGSDTAYHWGQTRWEPRRADESGLVTLRCLSGRIGAVVRGSDHAESAFLLLSWLASRHGSEELMSADVDSQPFRFSQLAAPERWLSESVDLALEKKYADALSSAIRQKEVLWMPQIPGASEYTAALNQAVRAAVSGEKTSQQALDAAAEQWKQITARYGVQKQRDAYRRSLRFLE
jgi:multiple sugar transport system substrate-binding protein